MGARSVPSAVNTQEPGTLTDLAEVAYLMVSSSMNLARRPLSVSLPKVDI